MESEILSQEQSEANCICSKFAEAAAEARRLCNNVLSNCLAFQVTFASTTVTADKKREVIIKYVDAMLDGISETTEFIANKSDYLPSSVVEAVEAYTASLLTAIDQGIVKSNDPWELFAIGARKLNAIDDIIKRIFGPDFVKRKGLTS